MKSKWIVLTAMALAVLLLEFFIERAPHTSVDGFGFHAWFGWGTCLLLVLAALLVGRVVKCRDDYYDD